MFGYRTRTLRLPRLPRDQQDENELDGVPRQPRQHPKLFSFFLGKLKTPYSLILEPRCVKTETHRDT